MMKKIVLLVVFSVLTYSSYSQQTYKTALGIRINGGAGITVKHFVKDNASLEGILYTRWHGLNIAGIYAVHFPVFTEPGFRFYMGGGSHLGFFNGDNSPWFDDEQNHTVWGLDGQIGLEYNFDKIPLNLALDWKPAVNIVGTDDIWYGDVGLSVRYTWK